MTTGQLAPAALALVDRYAQDELDCPATLARAGGVHLFSSQKRGLPGWRGYVLPVIALGFREGAVIAARPDLMQAVSANLGSDLGRDSLDHSGMLRLYRSVARLLPQGYIVAGDLLVASDDTFIPSPNPSRAEHIPRDDPAAAALRHRFDGEIFGIRGPRSGLIAWAAIKLKSADVWEMAVATEADYRGRGYARDVVSAATRYTLDQGRVPIYIHDHDNRSSAFVARSLGYKLYSEIVLAEF